MECNMNAKQIPSLRRRQTGLAGKISLLLLLAVSALLLVLGGCGGLNDDPAGGGLTVRYGFSDSGDGSSAQASSATIEPLTLTLPPGDEEVLSIVIGAIVITHIKDGASEITPYDLSDVSLTDGISERERILLEADLEQSIVFMEIIQLPTAEDTVSFPIPPDNAGDWQLLAIGLRHRIEALSDIKSNSPIYYGFIGKFLNGKVTPGEKISDDLKLEPGCALSDPPSPPC